MVVSSIRKEIYGSNQTDAPFESCLRLLWDLVDPFRIFQWSAVAVWLQKHYWIYALIFIVVSAAEIIMKFLVKQKVFFLFDSLPDWRTVDV